LISNLLGKDFKEYLENFSVEFNEKFNNLITNKNYPKPLLESMKYIALTGGKRIRPFLVCEVAKLFNIPFKESVYAATAIEMIHCYSLIHDDLPAMDDDDIRRGYKTLHKKFDEATAILAGDALLTDSFQIISKFYKDPKVAIKLITILSNLAGGSGMVGGQVLDLYPVSNNEKDILFMNKLKTGGLIKCSVLFGAIIGKADEINMNNLSQYGGLIGKAFQITDDILDISGTEEIIGKRVNKDRSSGKISLIDIYGKDGATRIAKKSINDAKNIINRYGEKGFNLHQLTEYILNRKK